MVKASARELHDQIEALRAVVSERDGLIAERDVRLQVLEARVLELQGVIDKLTRIVFAPKSERRPLGPGFELLPGQMHLLFPELVEAAERIADEKGAEGVVELHPPKGPQRPKRRKAFPEHLPRVRTTYELGADELGCPCGGRLTSIGEEVTRELERLEISVVHEHARTKYACKACQEGVTVAPGPTRVIDKGLLGPGFLATLLVERFGYHMPYNRLEKKYASEGLDLSRVVLCESAGRCADLLAPIAKVIHKDALSSGIVQTDDTGVTIKAGSKRNSRKSHVWVYRGHGGQVFYDMTESRNRDGPLEVLRGFEGYLQADALKVYDFFFKDGTILEVACWAHTRRKFLDAEAQEPEFAREAIDRIRELYAIERTAKDAELDADGVHAMRQAQALPLLSSFADWMSATKTKILDKGALAEAIRYAESNWAALQRYTTDGRLDIDNNAAERALRKVAVGRKNWMFFGNERGGRTAAIIYSLIATCQEHGVDPRVYLRDVLLRIKAGASPAELTPYAWKTTWQPQVEAHRASILERMLQGAAE